MVKVLVIGGGAAGMMAACAAADGGAEVVIAEKNEKLGKKLYITGKGRCNLTNACSREEFFAQIYSNPRFLYSAFSRFGNFDMMDFMEAQGVPLKTERGSRVFPVSDHSGDILDGLKRALRKRNVTVRLHTRALRLLTEENVCRGAELLLPDGKTKELFRADRVIVATGGLSYPSTGSTGDGYAFAKAAGHSVTACYPSLVPLEASLDSGFPVNELMGLSLKNVSVLLTQGGKELASDFGEMLFTHFGVSGPIILSCSAKLGQALRPETVSEKGPVRLELDLKPALSAEQLEERFLRETAEGSAGQKQIQTYLGGWLPRALIPAVLKEAGLPSGKRTAAIGKTERGRLFAALKALPMTVKKLRGYDEAIVTQGGISVKELQPASMASKKTEHLYFAGEVLDLDASTGGFNLQIAWSTAHAAGRAAAEEEKIMNRHIAIDGPAGSGKSTIAKAVAKETGLIYVDTGAMYRALAVFFLRKGLAASDEAGITAASREADVTIAYENGQQQVILNGENVTPYLRKEEVGQMASASSVYPAVREKMKALQQKLAAEKNVVMDGRDIGTVILPDAFLKIYMTAGSLVRAKRRFLELTEKGESADLEMIRKEIEERDHRDMNRAVAPLKQAEDAVFLDTSEMDIEEVTAKVLSLYREKK